MLSAIAARKAAQAAKLAADSPLPHTPTRKAEDTEGASEVESEKQLNLLLAPSAKRKPSATSDIDSVTHSQKKRRRKASRTVALRTRYFQEKESESSTQEEDALDTGEEKPDSSPLVEAPGRVRIVDYGKGLSDEDNLSIMSKPKNKKKRTWSPSQPAHDSSESEVDFHVENAPKNFDRVLAESQSHLSQQVNGWPQVTSLSFSPSVGKNTFLLSGNESGSLHGRKGTVVIMQEGETLALVGVYSITILYGRISLLGSELLPSTDCRHSVFAPKCSPIPIILALSPSSSPESLQLPDNISRQVDPQNVAIFLEDLNSGVEGLGKVCRTFEDVFEYNDLEGDFFGLTTARIIHTINRPLQPSLLPPSWDKALSSLSGPSGTPDGEPSRPHTVVVKGGKRTGKSTMARMVVNRLLGSYQRIAFLECDIGQTELTPPGLASLHVIDKPLFGPPFTHPQLPYASHFIGSISPRNTPSHYIASLNALVHTYKLELQYSVLGTEFDDNNESRIDNIIPLVVNTMGWTKGLGAEFIQQVEDMIDPSHIFTVGEQGTDANASKEHRLTDAKSQISVQIMDVEAIPIDIQFARYSAADWRIISTISYFHNTPSLDQLSLLPKVYQPSSSDMCLQPAQSLSCFWDVRLPLLARVPYAVSPASAIDGIILVGPGSEDVVSSEVARVLNGAVVALVSSQIGSPDTEDSSKHPILRYSQGMASPDPSASNCIGLALIRGLSPALLTSERLPNNDSLIDGESAIIHMLTPVPSVVLSASSYRCLVKGEIELPIWGMLDFRDLGPDAVRRAENIDGESVPYLQWNRIDAAGAGRRKTRRNLMRRGQM